MGDARTSSGRGEQPEDGAALAVFLEPALREACGGRLSKVEWFRSSWQAGGAGTGYATFTDDEGGEHQAVVKLPVGPVEHDWTTALGAISPERPCAAAACGPTPMVFAAGRSLGGYDLAWIVMERFAGSPLSQELNKQTVCELLETAVEWYCCARERREVTSADARPERDWELLLSKAREVAREGGIADAQHWNKLVHHVQKALPRLLSVWASRRVETWCHGDLHPGNAMWRSNGSGEGRRCVLIDLSLVHAGNWVEDAVYLERLFWGQKDRLDGVKPVARMAKALKERGLHPEREDYALLANVRRLLMAACVPTALAREGHPRYVGAALETLERLLPLLTRG